MLCFLTGLTPLSLCSALLCLLLQYLWQFCLSVSISAFFFISICIAHLQSVVFLLLTCISCKHHMCLFKIYSATLHLLIGEFSSLTFKIFIDNYVHMAILLTVFWLLLCFLPIYFFISFSLYL